MANDRVFIKCKGCGGWKMMFKYYPGSLYIDGDLVGGLINWLDTHSKCYMRLDNIPGMDLGDEPCFSLHTENASVKELDPERHGMEGTSSKADEYYWSDMEEEGEDGEQANG